MTGGVSLQQFALVNTGPSLTLSVRPGQWVAVVGPGGSGKTQFLRILAGLDRVPIGRIERPTAHFARPGGVHRRSKVASLARLPGGVGAASALSDLLASVRLWDQRAASVGDLSPTQMASAELLSAITAPEPLLCLDGQFDQLDPWALASTLSAFQRRRSTGQIIFFSTHRPELVKLCDAVVVLREREIRFAKSVEDLLRLGPPQEIRVETNQQASVRAICEPFDVSMSVEEDSVVLKAREGQELAARLLLEGYGNVRTVIKRAPSIEEALRNLFV